MATAAPLQEPVRTTAENPADRSNIWLLAAVLVSTLLPREVRVEFAGLVFFSERIALLACLPFVAKRMIDGGFKPMLVDWFILLSGFWMVFAMMQHYGFAGGLERGGALALDSTLGYLLARVCIRSLDDFRRLLIVMSPFIFGVGVIMMIESVLRTEIVQPLAEGIFGRLPVYQGGVNVGFNSSAYEIRVGLMRAKSVFPHSILAGLYMVSFLPLYWFSGLRGWPRTCGIIGAACCIFSVSSAALLGFALVTGMIVFEIFHKRIKYLNWTMLFMAIASLALAVHFISQSGLFKVVIRYATFVPHTGNFRLLIWEYGSRSVANNPVFGIGFESYERLRWMYWDSVDAHWLLVAMRFGLLPALLTFLTVIIVLVSMSLKSTALPLLERRIVRGVAIALGTLAMMMFTVNLLGGVIVWFTILLGLAANMAERGGTIAPVPAAVPNGQAKAAG